MIQITPQLAQRIGNWMTDPRTVGPTGECVGIIAELQAALANQAQQQQPAGKQTNGKTDTSQAKA